MRTRTRLAAAVLASALAAAPLAACDRGTGGSGPGGSPTPGGPTATAAASPSLSPSPTAPPTDPAIVFAADGIGNYIIGASLTDLQARALVTEVTESPHCTGTFHAKATGRYASTVTLTFQGGRLTALHTDSPTLVTPSGAKVGLTLAEVQGIYGSRGTLLSGVLGNKALSVRVPASALAIILYLDAANAKVAAMGAGEAAPLEDAVHNGEGC